MLLSMNADAMAVELALALGAASMLSVGPNNLALFREGLLRGRTALVVALISASQAGLAFLAWWAAPSVDALDPAARSLLSWGAVAVVLWFAGSAFRAGARRCEPQPAAATAESLFACVRRVLAMTALNPLTYLEFFFVPVAIIQGFGQPAAGGRFTAVLFAMILLCSVGYVALGRLVGCMATLRTRSLDIASGCVLLGVAGAMSAGLVATA